VYEGDARPNGLVQWALGSYALPDDELATLQPFDLEEARRLVDELGGLRMTLMYPTTPILEHDKHMPILLSQLREAGIEVEDDPQLFTEWVTNLRAINYQCTLNLNQIYETPEVPLAIHTKNGPFGDGTYLRGMDDAEIQAAVDAASVELDLEERVRLVHEAQRIIYAKDPISLPIVTPYVHIAWRKNVKNIPTGVGTSAFLLNTFWIES
jgi:ABC-type transport system substrate-binding protein